MTLSRSLAGAVAVFTLAVVARGQNPPAAAAATTSPDAKAQAILATSCVGCHDLGMLTARPHRADEWPAILQQMIANGANLSDDETKLLQAYLAKTYSGAAG